jgi:hypothetical protein
MLWLQVSEEQINSAPFVAMAAISFLFNQRTHDSMQYQWPELGKISVKDETELPQEPS